MYCLNGLTGLYSRIKENFHAFENNHPHVARVSQVALIFFAALTVVGIPFAVWGTYKICTSDKEIKKREEVFSNVADNDIDPKTQPAIANLQGSGKLTNNTVITVLNELKKQSKKFTYVDHCLVNNASVNGLKAQFKTACDENKRFISIPMILQNSFCSFEWFDHMVIMIYDRQEREMYYYDSQGKKISNETSKIKGRNQTPFELIQYDVLPKYITTSNTVKQQKDRVSCSVLALLACTALVEGKTFKEIIDERITNIEFKRGFLRNLIRGNIFLKPLPTERGLASRPAIKNQHGRGIWEKG